MPDSQAEACESTGKAIGRKNVQTCRKGGSRRQSNRQLPHGKHLWLDQGNLTCRGKQRESERVRGIGNERERQKERYRKREAERSLERGRKRQK